jgi:hypothetical protein
MTSMTLGTARSAYYDANGFGSDGGDSLEWVPIKLWKLTLKIPNTDGRRRAVKVHDLHHVVTGYQTTWTGEAEIAAWELSTGCLSSVAATVLNLGALAVGLVIAPHAIMRAWARGRHSKNLYREPGVDHLLPRTLDEVRAELALDRPQPRVRMRDAVATVAVALPPLAVLTALAVAPLVGLGLLLV